MKLEADVFYEIDCSKIKKMRLMEINDDGTPTGRRAIELHGKIPLSDMED